MSTSTADRLSAAASRFRKSRTVVSPQATSPAAQRQGPWFETAVSYASSIVVHLLIILLFATMLVAMPSRPAGELAINAAINDGQGDGSEEPLGSVPFEVPQAAEAVGAPNLSDVAVGAAGHESRAGIGAGANPVSLAGTALGALGGKGSGRGGPSVGFFGTKEAGAKFVFVVDGSGSMQGARFERALAELRKSIKDLKSWQKFSIIFFNDIPVPLYHPNGEAKLYASTSAQRVKANKWMKQIQPDGGTEPTEALKQALAMQPDVIFFLTDGEIPEETRAITMEANRYRTIVHTIAFESRDGEEMLKGIAKDNGGRYRYVP
ncbi:MAG: VWA domain-containing protein [Planctomycetaceae bacterium]